jgi:methionyl-tRNA formyltransferase
LRVVVFAYHEIGYVCLEELLRFGADVLCLFTHQDEPGEKIWFRTPEELAVKEKIPIYTPGGLRDPSWARMIGSLKPDIIFSFYYRYMIPKEILEIPRIGAFNLHGSLLPRFRGRCPVNWVLIEGETETGLTLHYMLEKPDAGDIIAQRSIPIDFEDTAFTLFSKMAEEARILMKGILPCLEDGSFARISQAGLGSSSYFGGRKPEDGIIRWEKDAASIYNLTRATTHPYPGAFTYLDGHRLFIWKAHPEEGSWSFLPGTVISSRPFLVNTGKGVLRVLRVQLEGEEEMDGDVFAQTHAVENTLLGGNT